MSTMYDVHEVSTGVFANRIICAKRHVTEDEALRVVGSITQQTAPAIIELAREQMRKGEGTVRVPANSLYDGAVCAEVELA